jgi:periplasmic protein TonB
MDDRVADVLAVRRKLAGSEITGIAGSLLLHLLILCAAVLVARQHPQPIAVPFIAIKFAPIPAAAGRVPKKQQKLPSAAPPPAKVEQPKIEQPVVETAKPLPEKSLSSRTVPISPFGKSTKKGEEKQGLAPAVAPSPAAPAAHPGVAIPAIGSAGVSGLEGGDFPYTIYIERMRTLIAGKWFRPQAASEALASVYFIIDRDGAIRDAKVESPSGDGTFDRAALRAVLEASPLPPLPFGYAGSYLGVHLTFH